MLIYIVSILLFLIVFIHRYIWVSPLTGIPHCKKNWTIGLGCTLSMMKNFTHIIDWKRNMINDIRKEALSKTGKEPEMIEWSITGSQPFVEILSPRCYQYMIKDNFNNFIKGEPFNAVFEEFLGEGIFNADGDKWRVQRKIASHLFSFKALNDYMLHVFNKHAQILINILNNIKDGEVVDMQVYFFKYTMDAICEIAFGINLNSMEDNGANPFALAFDRIQENCTYRFFSPRWLWKIKKILNIGVEREMKEDIALIDEFLYNIVNERKKNIEQYENSADLLSLFMNAAKKNNEEFSDKYLRDMICNFMLAGRDTTAGALTWLFYYLSEYPNVCKKIVQELDMNIGLGSEATHENMKNSLLLEAAFMEALRLRPSVPADSKIAVNDCTMPDGTFIPANTICVFSPAILNYLDTIYGIDADEFKPDRWIKEDDDTGQQKIWNPSPFEYPTFNAGPRLCLGKSMAILEGKSLAAMLLQRFEFTTIPNHNPLYRVTITQLMKYGLPMTIKKRTQ